MCRLNIVFCASRSPLQLNRWIQLTYSLCLCHTAPRSFLVCFSSGILPDQLIFLRTEVWDVIVSFIDLFGQGENTLLDSTGDINTCCSGSPHAKENVTALAWLRVQVPWIYTHTVCVCLSIVSTLFTQFSSTSHISASLAVLVKYNT